MWKALHMEIKRRSNGLVRREFTRKVHILYVSLLCKFSVHTILRVPQKTETHNLRLRQKLVKWRKEIFFSINFKM